MNKKHIIAMLVALMSQTAIQAQTYDNLWITGSAVPGGLQKLDNFPNNQYKFA